jgi:Zn ribbon nucleic-acid-binding protein
MINNMGGGASNESMGYPRVDISQSTSVVCENCGHNKFRSTIKIRKVSKLLFGGTEDGIIPFDILECVKCGTDQGDLKPKELKDLEAKDELEKDK